MPSRQTSWGARPVTSRPSSTTAPASGLRWPVIRLKSVVLPAPLGPMIAAIIPRSTRRLTPPTAMKPSKLLRTSRTSSTPRPPQAAGGRLDGAGQAAREHEEQHHQDRPQHEGPVLGVGHDLLVEQDQHERADGGAIERAHPAEQGHDQHLGRLGPIGEVREDAAVEDAEDAPREPGEGAGQDERSQLVATDVYPDELGALRVLADRHEHEAERRADDPPEYPQAQ